MSVCFLNFIPRSHIYRDMAVVAFLSGLHGWMFGSLGCSSAPAKLVGWPLQLKNGTAADFTCKLCSKNKTQRQSHIRLVYFLVQYHFAQHPPFDFFYWSTCLKTWNNQWKMPNIDPHIPLCSHEAKSIEYEIAESSNQWLLSNSSFDILRSSSSWGCL